MEWPNQTSRRRTATSVAARARVYLFFFVLAENTTFEHSNTSHHFHGMENHVANASVMIRSVRTTPDLSRLAMAAHQTTVLCQQSWHFVVFVYFLPDTKAQNSLRTGQNIVWISFMRLFCSNLQPPNPQTRFAPMGMWHVENLWESSLQIRIRLMNYIKKNVFFFLLLRRNGCLVIPEYRLQSDKL